MARGSNLFKAMVGLVTGSAVGWVAHDRYDKSSIFGALRSNGIKGTEENDNVLGIISPLPGTKSYQPVVPWDSNWDRRDPKFLVKPTHTKGDDSTETHEEDIKNKTPKVSRHLLLIRHGQYNENGSSDALRMLTSLGMEQADLTGQRLQDLGHPYTTIIHSSMKRAIETAAIIHKHLPDLPIVQCDLLREGAPWPPEPPSRNWRPEYKQFYQDGARIEAAFRKYFHRADPSQQQDSYEIIVCHANVIRYFVCRALQIPPEAWLRMSLHHGSITWVTIRPNGLVGLKALGDAGFMPSDKISVV